MLAVALRGFEGEISAMRQPQKEVPITMQSCSIEQMYALPGKNAFALYTSYRAPCAVVYGRTLS
jgi:hypothetical protein